MDIVVLAILVALTTAGWFAIRRSAFVKANPEVHRVINKQGAVLRLV